MGRSSQSDESRSRSRSKNRKPSDNDDSFGWNPFQKIISLVTGNEESDSVTSDTNDPQQILFRWTSTCFTATCPLFSRNPNFNMLYCPLPSLLMFAVVHYSTESIATKQMQRLFELSEQDFKDITSLCEIIHQTTSSRAFYFFIQFLVDEEKTTTVSKELMQQCAALFKKPVFASISPSKVVKYLSTLGFSTAPVSRPSLLSTNSYGSCGLVGSWEGKAKTVGALRFAPTYQKRKMEMFFELQTQFRRVLMDEFEIIEINFTTNDKKKSPGSFLIFRPIHLGNLPYSNRTLNSTFLKKALEKLAESDVEDGCILLPQFTVSSCHDLWKNLLRHGMQSDLGQSHKSPPMASMWHYASLCVSADGVREKMKKSRSGYKLNENEKCTRRVDGESLFEKHKPYSVRIDSPFSYLVLLRGLPIFNGSYFGTPPPKGKEIFVNASERIREMRATRYVKKKLPETRQQKLWKKIHKAEAIEREKARKLKLKAKRAAKKQKSKSKSNSVSSSSASTSASEESSSTSSSVDLAPESEPVDKKKDKEEKKEKKEKKEQKEKKEKNSRSKSASRSASKGWNKIKSIFKKSS